MFCPYCGKMIPDDSSFCPVCGEKLDGEETINEKNGGIDSGHKKGNTGKIVVLFLLGIIILATGAGMVYFMKQANETSLDEKVLEGKTEKEKIQEQLEKDTQNTGENEQDNTTEEKAEQPDTKEENQYDPTEGGIHRYEYVVADVTWNQAFTECISKGGHLVRINSQEEYDYILNELSSKQLEKIQFFIGGRRDSGSNAYYWTNEKGELYGEQINTESYWCNSEWLNGEPSFSDNGNEEKYLDLLYYKKSGKWTWNDAPDDILAVVPEFSGRIGYICEYDN